MAQTRPDALIVIIDASTSSDTRNALDDLRSTYPTLQILYEEAEEPGVSRQRNQAARLCIDLGVEIIHFLDDDAEIIPGYLCAIEQRFIGDPEIAGVGGLQENLRKERHPRFNRLFLLSGKYPYTIRKSGRVVMPQPSHGAKRIANRKPVEWLQGFAMSYRASIVREFPFDERLAFGEDRDIGFRISRNRRLAIEPKARCLHHRADANRLGARRFGRRSTIETHVWVREQRRNGLSPIAFLWSVLGDALRHGMAAMLAGDPDRAESFQQFLGILDGLFVILRRHKELAS